MFFANRAAMRDPGAKIRQQRRCLGVICLEPSTHRLGGVVGATDKFRVAASVALAVLAGALKYLVITLATVGARKSPGYSFDQHFIIHHHFYHTVELALEPLEHFVERAGRLAILINKAERS